MLEQRDRKLLDRERELEAARQQLAQAQLEHVAALERVSGMSAADAKAQLLEAVRDEAEREGVRIAKAIERAARDEAEERAREIVLTTMQRIAADHTAEHTVSAVHLPNDEMKGRIIGREGRNIRALEQATGVDLIIDDTPETVVISAFDPVRREVARVALTKLMADGRIHPGRIEEVVAKARAEVDTIMRQAGEQAIYEAGIPALPAEIVKLLGRLKYRTSYGQNVLVHSVETSRLAAIIAAELGLDVQAAKVGGLLHDMGKAVDHEVEGPARPDRGPDRAAAQPLAQGRERHRLPPPGSRIRLHGGAGRPGRRRDQRLSPRRPRRVAGDLRPAARRSPGHRRELRRRGQELRRPGRPRGPHPRSSPSRSTTSPPHAWPATWSRRSRPA